jgi:hypothetical protein
MGDGGADGDRIGREVGPGSRDGAIACAEYDVVAYNGAWRFVGEHAGGPDWAGPALWREVLWVYEFRLFLFSCCWVAMVCCRCPGDGGV